MSLNLDKLADETVEYWRVWWNPPPPKHDDLGTIWTNRFTEATKAAPYFASHVDQFLWPLSWLQGILALVWIAFRFL